MNILFGILAVLAGVIIYWVYSAIKATKDPDVQNAAKLRMSVTSYRKYQAIYNEFQDFMLEHGYDSPATEKKFSELFKQIKNPNEWRRYQAFREEVQRNEILDAINKS